MSANHITSEDAQDALDRLNRAIKRRTGCYLTPRMVAGLSISFIGELASQPRPVGSEPRP